MGEGSHVRVSYERAPNFFERLGSSFVGVFLGLAAVVAGCTLLFWNEGRAVHTYQMLVETRSVCSELREINHVVESLNGKLVSVSGPLTVPQPAIDPKFEVSALSAVLRRSVDMYQWVEETRTKEYKESDGSIRKETEYSYTTQWRHDLVSSRGFDDTRHTNPSEFPINAQLFFAPEVKLGAFSLSKDVLEYIANWRSVVLSSSSQLSSSNYALYNNMLYLGDPQKPKVGDVRVKFEYAGSGDRSNQQDELSVVGAQRSGGVLGHFTHRGETFLLVYPELLTMEEMFAKEHASNTSLTWILRAVGWFIIFVGFKMMSGLLVTLVDWLPFVRELVTMATTLLCVALSFSLAVLVMGVAWFRYRPLLALLTVGVAALPYIITRIVKKPKRS